MINSQSGSDWDSDSEVSHKSHVLIKDHTEEALQVPLDHDTDIMTLKYTSIQLKLNSYYFLTYQLLFLLAVFNKCERVN